MDYSKNNKERRNFNDRRKRPTPILSRHTFLGGQRKSMRRKDDKGNHIFVDVYSTRLMIILLSLLIFSYVDAFLTLSLIKAGIVTEANPVLSFYLELDTSYFILNKTLLTAVSLVILCLHKNFLITKIGLPFATITYISVITYQIYIMRIHFPH